MVSLSSSVLFITPCYEKSIMQVESICLLSILILGTFLIIKGYYNLSFLKKYQSYPLVTISFNEITIAKTTGTGMYSESPMYYIQGVFIYKTNNLNIVQYDSGFDASFYRFLDYEDARVAIDRWKKDGCKAHIQKNKLILDIPINVKYKNQHFTTLILSGILLNVATFVFYALDNYSQYMF